MNRETLFRGKRVDNGEWIYGSLVTGAFVKSATGQDIPYIFNTDECSNADCFEDFTDDYGYYEVDPSTVGQYTGLTDSKGNKVFEGDIVKGGIYTAYEIKWDSYRAEFNTGAAGLSVSEVIGTIHDTHLTKQS